MLTFLAARTDTVSKWSRRACFLVCLVFAWHKFLAQTPTVQDCLGAIPICKESYVEPTPYRYTGEGNYSNEIFKPHAESCITDENNGVWYIFTAQETGGLRFSLEPDNPDDDYDWIVFDMTYASCSDLRIISEELYVSTNNYGSYFYNGFTGANSDSSGGFAGNCNGPNDFNGPPWNDDINIEQGHSYLIYISNWEQTLNGYTIDFSKSSVSIGDNLNPTLLDIVEQPICGQTSFSFYFSERVQCSSIQKEDFSLTGPGGEIRIESITGAACLKGAEYGNEYTITVNEPLYEGQYLLSHQGIAYDACDNVSDDSQLEFEVENNTYIEYVNITDVTQCGNDKTGRLVINGKTDGSGLLYSINGGKDYTYSNYFRNLGVGKYQCIVKSNFGCTSTIRNAEIEGPVPIIIKDIDSKDVHGCSDSKNGQIQLHIQGGTPPYLCSIDGGKTYFKNSGLFENLDKGQYTVSVKDSYGCIINGGKITITAPEPLEFTVDTASTIKCHGDKTGSIVIDVTSGVAPVYYSINNGINWQVNNTFTNKTAGEYFVKVKDGNACIVADTFQIYEPEPLEITLFNHSDSTLCFDDKSATVNIEGRGGTGPLKYSIDGGLSYYHIGKIYYISGGEYRIKLIDTNGCALDGPSFSIYQPPLLEITSVITKDVTVCYNNNNGQISLTASGGTSPYEYLLMPDMLSSSTPVFDSLAAGAYKVSVRDKNLCNAPVMDVEINAPPPLSITHVEMKPVICPGGSDGEITIYRKGGQVPVMFSINNGATWQNSNQFRSLSGGIYILVIQDANGCRVTDSVTLLEPEPLEIKMFSEIDLPTCFGDEDGAIQFTASGGTAPYYYNLHEKPQFVTSNGLFSKLPAGDYGVTITDANHCIGEFKGYSLHNPPTLSLEAQKIIKVTCRDSLDGKAELTAKGGVPPYSWSLNKTGAYQSAAFFDSIGAGTYYPSVKDSNGCIAYDNPFTLNNPPSFEVQIIDYSDTLICFGDKTGEIAIKLNGGEGDYTIALNDTGQFVPFADTLTQLLAGQYKIKAKDARGCIISSKYVQIYQPSMVSVDSAIVKHVQCFGFANGAITLLGKGGTGKYSYSIDDGKTFLKDSVFLSLDANQYFVQIKDNNQCLSKIDTLTLQQPQILAFLPPEKRDISCFGEHDGHIELDISGGTKPYYVSIDNGQYFQESKVRFDSLAKGAYFPIIRDDNNCYASIDSIQIDEPDKLSVDSIHITHIETCFGNNEGQLMMFSSGGTGVHSYSFDSITYFENNGHFPGLYSGVYKAIVKDGNSCVAEYSNEIFISQPDELRIDSLNYKNNTCFGGNNGLIQIFASGGTGKYTYIMPPIDDSISSQGVFDSLSTQTYFPFVLDENGCQSTRDTVIITEPNQLVIDTVLMNEVSCYNGNDGLLQITVSGGVRPYAYALQNDPLYSNDSTFTSLTAGTYTILLKDSMNCSATFQNYVVEQAPEILLDSVLLFDVTTCYGDSTGSIDVYSSGGTGIKQISADRKDYFDSHRLEGLPAGQYNIFVKDENECVVQSDLSFVLKQPDSMYIASIEKTDMTCFGLANGTIHIEAKGGTGKLKYCIEDSICNETGAFLNLYKGGHSIQIVDNNSCRIKSGNITIFEPDEIQIEEQNVNHVSCYGLIDGAIEIKIFAANNIQYTIEWSNGSTHEDIYELGADIYTVYVEDVLKNHCAFGSFQIKEPPLLQWQINAQDASCDFYSDGYIDTTIAGGTLPYQFSVFNSNDIEISDFSALPTDIYTLKLEDNNGCQLFDTIKISVIGTDCEPELYIPNIFTPNGDNRNDFLTITPTHIEDYVLEIYTRWGRKVYAYHWKDDVNYKGWDGKIDNSLASPGVYYLIIWAQFKNGIKKTFKQAFQLYR